MLPSEEGYVKYKAHWTPGPPLPAAHTQALGEARQRLYRAGLIGVYPDGVGYGNLSSRLDAIGRFVITGTATGHLPALTPMHYAVVTHVETDANALWCEGPIAASSESMSHAALYAACPWVQAVAHVHHLGLWERLLHHYPTTAAEAAYGTPAMARSIVHLLRTTDLPQRRLLVMHGHKEGLIAFGELEETVELLLHLAHTFQQSGGTVLHGFTPED